MKTFEGIILSKTLGWKITGEFPSTRSAVVIFFDNNSPWDALIEKLYLRELRIPFKYISVYPLFMDFVNKINNHNPITADDITNSITECFARYKNICVTFSLPAHFNNGFTGGDLFQMVLHKSKVPLILCYCDSANRVIGVQDCFFNRFTFNDSCQNFN